MGTVVQAESPLIVTFSMGYGGASRKSPNSYLLYGYGGASRKSPNDAPWKMLNQWPSRPVSAHPWHLSGYEIKQKLLTAWKLF